MKNKTLKPALGMGLIALALGLSMCKKQQVSDQQPDNPATVSKPGMVPSPDYHLNEAQNYKLVMDFKKSAQLTARGGGSPDSLEVDSAQYTLEAAINFDFDYPANADMLEVSYDVSNYAFNADASARPSPGYIYRSELNAISAYMHDHFNTILTAGSRIAAIDVVAYIDDAATGEGHFEVTASVMAVNGQPYRCATNIWNATTNYPNANWSEINGIFNCGLFTYSQPGVRLQFQAAMNCRDLYYAGCTNGYYFPVVTTVSSQAAPNDNRLFYATTANALSFCGGTAGFLSGATYNSKLVNAKNYVLNNVATTPGGVSLVDNSTTVTLGGYQVPQSAAGVLYWTLSFQKGVRNCRPIQNG